MVAGLINLNEAFPALAPLPMVGLRPPQIILRLKRVEVVS